MKSLSLKTNVFLTAWLLCTGILIFVFFGWLSFPNDMAINAYVLGWLASTNALLTGMLQSSRIAVVALLLGWMGALVLCLPHIGVIPSTEYAIVFATLLASTIVAMETRFVHIASYGGSGTVRKKGHSPVAVMCSRVKLADHSDRTGGWGATTKRKGRSLLQPPNFSDGEAAIHRSIDSPNLLDQHSDIF